mgnify:CR=1 FL=1|tara:strand:+ start:2738 stop:3565 length:828 start_codon:yes stop_codon:yes gene_type:complete
MANQIQIKHSNTGGNAPSSLAFGELAWNQADHKLFVGDVSNASSPNTLVEKINATGEIGLASFNAADFAVSGAGDVTVKALGITNAQLAGSIANSKLANSSVTVSDGSNTSPVSLGGTLTIQGTSNEVEVGESNGTFTLGIPTNPTLTGNTIITGNLTVQGTTTTVDSQTLVVEDGMMKLAKDNTTNALSYDVGLYAPYNVTSTDAEDSKYTAIYRDASDNKWYIVNNLSTEPGQYTQSETLVSNDIATLKANLEGFSSSSFGTISNYTIDCGSF